MQGIAIDKGFLAKTLEVDKGKDAWVYIKLRSFCGAKETLHKVKRQMTQWEKCVQTMQLIKD